MKEKIKNFFFKITENFKDILKKYPITMGIVILLTALTSLCMDDFIIEEDVLIDILSVGSMTLVGTLFWETIIKENKLQKILGAIISLLIGLFFYYCEDILGVYLNKVETLIFNIMAAYFITLPIITIWKLSSNVQMDIKEYLLKVAAEGFLVGITFSVLCAGIAAVCSIFIALILGEGYFFILRMLVLALGLYYIPAMLNLFVNTDKIEVNKFIEKLLVFVLLPLTLAALLIIYIYIGKIIILRKMPENLVGRILIALFCAAIPIWAAIRGLNKEKTSKIANIIPYAYSPLMILEIYSLVVRIFQYGLTPIRYLVILFIIFQIITLALILLKKEDKLKVLFLIFIIFELIFLVSPLNYNNVSNWSQKNILDKVVEKNIDLNNCSKEELNKYRGAYQYLDDQTNGEKYINKELTQTDREILNSYYNLYGENNYYEETKPRTYYLYVRKIIDEIDVENYKKIYIFDENYYNYKGKANEIDVKNLKIEYGDNKIIYVDLENYIKELINKNELDNNEEDEYFEENNVIKVNDKLTLYLNGLSLEYEKESKKITEFSNISGYILEK